MTIFLANGRREYRCRYCLTEFWTEGGGGYCAYAPDSRHHIERRALLPATGFQPLTAPTELPVLHQWGRPA